MNRSLREIGGGLLLVPQFTLAADTRKGMRPAFTLPRRRPRRTIVRLSGRTGATPTYARRHRPLLALTCGSA